MTPRAVTLSGPSTTGKEDWPLAAARTPRTVWVELTSKCPFDCVFCSRRTLRRGGEHMPFNMVESLFRQLSDPRTLLLNYSGESATYPDLIRAIRLGRSTGAFVELVTALACIPESLLLPLSRSGLGRLTVSIHAATPEAYQAIYRYASFETLRARLTRFLDLCRDAPEPPIVDAAFVAMDRNLAQLPAVAGFAMSVGLRDIYIFPVIRRDEIPERFPVELTAAGDLRPEFRERAAACVASAERTFPGISLHICNPAFTAGSVQPGEVPRPFPGCLPPGARIYSCDQNPWETAHVLSNGDVVACEVLDKRPLGNLARQSVAEIWRGPAYEDFRGRYFRGEVPECRSCPWKKAWRPGPMWSEIIGSRGGGAQLLHGWHEAAGEAHVWSSQQAAAVLAPCAGSRILHVSGSLPPGPAGQPNVLTIRCNGAQVGKVVNPWEEIIPFGLDFPIPEGQSGRWSLEFRTAFVFRPRERGMGPDQRDLGFALALVASKQAEDGRAAARRGLRLRPLRGAIRALDLLGRTSAALAPPRIGNALPEFRPGLSVVIPEWDNVEELTACLTGVRQAAKRWKEPIETIVVVNGSPAADYEALRAAHSSVRWQFHARPLGFCGAVAAGLRAARFDWVYLLNNDVVLDPGALLAAGRLRENGIFGVASQIALKDPTQFREETNWTTLFLEDGLATIHDLIPQTGQTRDTFYAGGGASLFRACLLRSLLDVSAYEPFYWEDVEWGWRARKLGYRSAFCPDSVAYHTRRSTIARRYTTEEIETALCRNRLLFQLRNLTQRGLAGRALDQAARSPGRVADAFLEWRTLWKIARGRWWNYRAPASDAEVLSAAPAPERCAPPPRAATIRAYDRSAARPVDREASQPGDSPNRRCGL